MHDPKPCYFTIVASFCGLLLVASPALAYVGPGAGMEYVGYLMSLLTWLGIAFSTILLWPFYALMHRIRSWRRAKSLRGQPEMSPAVGSTAGNTNLS